MLTSHIQVNTNAHILLTLGEGGAWLVADDFFNFWLFTRDRTISRR